MVRGALRRQAQGTAQLHQPHPAQFDYADVVPEPVELPDRKDIPYVRPPMHEQTFVPIEY